MSPQTGVRGKCLQNSSRVAWKRAGSLLTSVNAHSQTGTVLVVSLETCEYEVNKFSPNSMSRTLGHEMAHTDVEDISRRMNLKIDASAHWLTTKLSSL
jgi:phenylalanyl-tRNA synthetase beta subunit